VQALVRAEELNQPLVLVNGLLCAALLKLLRGDYDEARQLTQKLDALTREYNLPVYRIGGAMLQGGIAVHRGTSEEGIAGITAGLSQCRALGAQQLVPFFLSCLAEGYRQQGKIEEALQVVGDALSLTATNFDVFWEAELYRQKGELLLRMGERKKGRKGEKSSHSPTLPPSHSSPEAYFLKAVDIAREQGAKLLELRAVMSLSRLWYQQGKQEDARRMLAEIYDWFTEGFDTKNLQTARALLAEWSAAPRNVASPAKRSSPR
jgi:predicted ATPase